MADRIPFLTARWLNLALLTYRLEPKMLLPFVPPHCELDLIDGHGFASLVAFDFTQTRVLGIPWPGFINFPEVNLRFYIRHGNNRGVCFISEIVRHRTVARIARWIYNEPYMATLMESRFEKNDQTIGVHHDVVIAGKSNTIDITATASTICPAADSMECFLKEHEWGFGTSRSGRLIRYKVLHPIWNIHPVLSWKLNWDWQAVYGQAWAPLQTMQPMSVILAEGSAVKVFPYGTLNP
jgi:uncharacterized protein YqjF (DUF2071 family)